MSGPPDPQQLAERVLEQLVAAARGALSSNLSALVLYGSAVEKRLRASSDVNLLFVLEQFEAGQLAALSPALRTAEAAIRLSPLFVLRTELADACEAFPERFADIARRHRLLHGSANTLAFAPSRRAIVQRLAQVLLNDALRLRRSYALQCLREEQAARALAEVTGPLRSCAASLLELKGERVASPKEALQRWAERQPDQALRGLVASMARVHAGESLQPSAAAPALLAAVELALQLRAEVLALPEQ